MIKTGGQSAGKTFNILKESSETLCPEDTKMNLHPRWVVGFVDGEGCFHIGISKNPTMKNGIQVLPEFVVTQHKRDVQVLYGLKAFFKCGIVRHEKPDILCFRVRERKALETIIIPFFEKYKLKTRKRQDFLKFRRVLKMMSEGLHLSTEGINEIRILRESPSTKET